MHTLLLEPSARTRPTPQVLRQANIPLRLCQQLRIPLASMTVEYTVHFFERFSLGLWYEDPYPDKTREQESSEEDIRQPDDSLEHAGHEEGDGEVVDPIGGGTDGGALRADREREDFRDKRPGDWTPSRSKTSNVNPDEGNANPSSAPVRRPICMELRNQDADDDHADEHDGASDD